MIYGLPDDICCIAKFKNEFALIWESHDSLGREIV